MGRKVRYLPSNYPLWDSKNLADPSTMWRDKDREVAMKVKDIVMLILTQATPFIVAIAMGKADYFLPLVMLGDVILMIYIFKDLVAPPQQR